MSRVQQGVSTDHIALGKQSRAWLHTTQLLKQLIFENMECQSLDQEERHLQLPVLVLVTGELFKVTDCG